LGARLAVVVVLILTLVMLSLLLVNSTSVLQLRKKLNHIDQKQMQKYRTL
jgi:heme exporter protein D